MNSLTDTHCHLYLPHFDNDRETVLKQALDLGITKILIPGIDIKSSEQAINLCASYPGLLYAAIGIHPNSKTDFNETHVRQLKELAKSKYVVAIGEIGLDYYRLGNSVDHQKMIFRSQLDIASELNLAVCIHDRDASRDVIQIVDEWITSCRGKSSQFNPKGVFHSFNGTLEIGNTLLRFGFYLGIAGQITYSSNLQLSDTIKNLPKERILIETDAPYLTPHPFRGQRNVPANVKYIAKKLAELYQIELGSLENITNKNANDIFRWD